MDARVPIVTALLWTALAVHGADAKPAGGKKRVLLDLSTEAVMDSATAKAILAEAIPARVWKLYPPRRWGFVSQVEGGFTDSKTCVVTARVMLAPLTVTDGVILRPEKRATVFDAIPNATREQCRQLARDKLREAADVVVSSLVKG
jgi:hypothetical protein